MTRSEFHAYVYSFYGPNSDLYPMNASMEQIEAATDILIARGDNVEFDSVDREKVRDILIDQFGLVFPEPPGAWHDNPLLY